MHFYLRGLSLLLVVVLFVGVSQVEAQDWESNGVDSEIEFNSSGGRGLDFTPNSDGSHWLWFHNDGSSGPTQYGAQLYSGGGKVWRLVNRSAGQELVHVGTDGSLYTRGRVGIGTPSPEYDLDLGGGRIGGVVRVIKFSSSNGYGLDFRPNSDGSHWLWVHDDGSSNSTEYGAQLNSSVGKVWRLENRSADQELVHVGANGRFYVRGNLGVGTQSPNEKLSVAGNVLAEEVVVKPQSEWADYVFSDSYDLPPLEAVERFIEEEGRLPEVPSAEAVKDDGLRLGEMDATLLQKVEELTLYAIEQKKQIDSLETELLDQCSRANRQKARASAQQDQLEVQDKRIRQLERQVEALRSALQNAGIGAESPTDPG